MAELRKGVSHFHCLEFARGTESDSKSHRGHYGFGDFDAEPGPVGDAPAPGIGALFDSILRESIDHLSIRSMNLNFIKPSPIAFFALCA
jgi:hypothetical protein